jgi:hypothetical protein
MTLEIGTLGATEQMTPHCMEGKANDFSRFFS